MNVKFKKSRCRAKAEIKEGVCYYDTIVEHSHDCPSDRVADFRKALMGDSLRPENARSSLSQIYDQKVKLFTADLPR